MEFADAISGYPGLVVKVGIGMAGYVAFRHQKSDVSSQVSI